MTGATPGAAEMLKAPEGPSMFDRWHPANTSPIVVYLATDDCPFNGQVSRRSEEGSAFCDAWPVRETVSAEQTWTVEDLRTATKDWQAGPPAMPQGRAETKRHPREHRDEEPNMPLSPDAVGATGDPRRWTWTSKDALLYALGIGAGRNDLSFPPENTAGVPQRGTRRSPWWPT